MKNKDYPVNLYIDYPEKSNRFLTLFRPFVAIPIFILLFLIIGVLDYDFETDTLSYSIFPSNGAGLLFLPTLLMIVIRKKYPKWWFDWNISLTKFVIRIFTFLLLLRDEYPSTDEDQAVHIVIPYPDGRGDLNRFLPLVKWFLVIPHIIVLIIFALWIIVWTITAWITILIVGKYPKAMFHLVEGILRWYVRVLTFAFLLTTDVYPPFRLSV